MNSFIGNTECNDYRIGDDTVKALYKGDTLIWEKISPEVPWDFAFRFNFNAKQFNEETRTIPNKEGGLETRNLVIPEAGMHYIEVFSKYLDFVGSSSDYRVTWDFGSYSSNPYRVTQNDEFTLIYKILPESNEDYSQFLNCRDRMSAYNWMVQDTQEGIDRQVKFNVGGSQILYIPRSMSSYDKSVIVGITHESGDTQFFGRVNAASSKYFDNNYVTSISTNFNMSNSKLLNFFGDNNDPDYFIGRFYWVFLSKEKLSLEQMNKVIQYNENL